MPESRDVAPTANVIVRFRIPGPAQQFTNATGTPLQRGDAVVVHAGDDVLMGTVSRQGLPQRPIAGDVVRPAQRDDVQMQARNTEREQQALQFCRERVKALALPIKLISAELTHDAARATFYFVSAERIDFRALVKDLARRLHVRVEMRQIGVRDAARHTGGTGVCGQTLCCSTWLPEFQPISIRMAKDQNLPLNQQKLSGLCGRLRCCLQYEQSTYQQERKTLPKVGKRVGTPQGQGRVHDLNILRRLVTVALDAGGIAEFAAADILALPPR